jgi:hypothetical protein
MDRASLHPHSRRMATQTRFANVSVASDRLELGSRLITLAGVAVFLYALLFLVIDFTAFTELGLTAQQVGGQPLAISGYSPALFNYISHLQVALSGFMMAFAIQIGALAWYGVRRRQRWALWTIAVASVAAYLIAIPLHFVYGLATLVHLGPFALVAIVLIAGIWLAQSGMTD